MQTHDPSADVRTSREIARLTSALSLEEKAALTVGIDTWRTASFPRNLTSWFLSISKPCQQIHSTASHYDTGSWRMAMSSIAYAKMATTMEVMN